MAKQYIYSFSVSESTAKKIKNYRLMKKINLSKMVNEFLAKKLKKYEDKNENKTI